VTTNVDGLLDDVVQVLRDGRGQACKSIFNKTRRRSVKNQIQTERGGEPARRRSGRGGDRNG
jgi:hypothetical protein